MSSSADEHGTRGTNRVTIRELCTYARQDRRFALLLEACLADPPMSRVLLLHKTELFPRLELPIEGARITVAAGGLPFLSHAPKQIRRSLKILAAKYAGHSPHPARMADAQQRVKSMQSAVSEPLQDAFALAILNTVAANPPLLELVKGPMSNRSSPASQCCEGLLGNRLEPRGFAARRGALRFMAGRQVPQAGTATPVPFGRTEGCNRPREVQSSDRGVARHSLPAFAPDPGRESPGLGGNRASIAR